MDAERETILVPEGQHPILDPDGWGVLDSGLIVPGHIAQRMTAVDLFCGAGGFSLGLLQAGFHVLAGVDNDEHCLLTYLHNLGAYPIDIRFVEPEDEQRLEDWMQKHVMKKGDNGIVGIASVSGSNRQMRWGPPGWEGVPVYWFGNAAKLSGERILRSIGLKRGELDLVVGGPPCQGFSLMGKREVADPRNNLTFEFARLVTEMQPRTMCMENVPGILSMKTMTGAPVMDEVCRILERGDFGEFEALRSIMAGDRRMIQRGAGKKAKAAKPKDKVKDDGQRALFE